MPEFPLAYHGTLWREMELLGRIGFYKYRSSAMPRSHREIMGWPTRSALSRWGNMDLTILQENPLIKIETCRKPQMVIKNGESLRYRTKLN